MKISLTILSYLYVLEGGANKIAVLSLKTPGAAPVVQVLDLSPIAKNNITLGKWQFPCLEFANPNRQSDGNFTAGLAIYNP